MARNKGTFQFAANFEVKAAEALDPRTLVSTKAELIQKETWPYDGDTLYLYNGLLVSVAEEQAIYMLVNKDNALASDYSGWVKQSFDPAEIEGVTIVDNLTSDSATDALSAKQGKALSEAIASISIAEAETTTGMLKSYKLMLGDAQKGVTIDIPKDLVVSDGSVLFVEEVDAPYAGAQVGDAYIKLVIANGSPLYIPAKSLVDVYTQGQYINITDNTVSVDYDSLKAQIKTDLSIPDDFSDTIDSLSSDVDDLKSDVEGLDSTLNTPTTGVVAKISALESEVDTLGTSVSSLGNSVADISEILNGDGNENEGLVAKVEAIETAIADYDDVKSDIDDLKSADETLSGRLDNVESAVAEKVAGVTAGNGISVDNTTATSPKVSVKPVTGGGIAVDSTGVSVNMSELIAADTNIDVDDDGKLTLSWITFVDE